MRIFKDYHGACSLIALSPAPAYGKHSRSIPAVALTGPRQCGKTTLAREIAADGPGESTFFDLESAVGPAAAAGRRSRRCPACLALSSSTKSSASPNSSRPSACSSIGPATERGSWCSGAHPLPSSAAPRNPSRDVSGLVDLSGFQLSETGAESWRALWLRGGFPRSFLAPHDRASAVWRRSFVRTFLERDIPQLGLTVPAETPPPISGRCSRITTARHGTQPSSPVPSDRVKARRGGISTS